jgi:hypothetical protein
MRRRKPQHFCAGDLLWLDGRDLRLLPFVERKANSALTFDGRYELTGRLAGLADGHDAPS